MANFKIFTSKHEQNERLSVCQSCEHYNQERKVCPLCSCYMPIKVRVSWLKCPINKWGHATTTQEFDIDDPDWVSGVEINT